MEILDFTNKAMACNTEAELFSLFADSLREDGYDNYAISSFTAAGPVIHAGVVPHGWEEYYMRQRYFECDPVFIAQATIWESHFWADTMDENTPKQARDFMGESELIGLRNGHTCSLAVDGAKWNFAPSARDNHREHLRPDFIAKTFARASVIMAKRSTIIQMKNRMILSGRQLEVAKRIAENPLTTNAEIAEAMGITESTVETHIQRICLKNGCGNKVDIGVRAILDPNIHII